MKLQFVLKLQEGTNYMLFSLMEMFKAFNQIVLNFSH